MRKMTLLQMVQNILSALDSDEVNSISDTVESLQVAEIIKETFYEQFNNIYIPEFESLFQLESANDTDRPNYLKIPSNVSKVVWIKYRDLESGTFRELEYVPPEEFLSTQLSFNPNHQNLTEITDTSGIKYSIENNRGPTRFTVFDDAYIAFDAFDSNNEAVVQSTNSIGYGVKTEEFKIDDDYVPPIDGNLFPLLLAESKATSFINLKQISSSKEEQRARRQRIRMQNDQFKSRHAQYEYWNRGPDFSRRR